MTDLGNRDFDNLIAKSEGLVTAAKTLVSGQNVVRGEVLGKITASGKYKIYQSGSVDGSEIPSAVAAEDCDASAGDKECTIYTAGVFNKNALVFDGADTFAAAELQLQDYGIRGKGSIDTDGVHTE